MRIDTFQCIGCTSCAYSCPQNAISIIQDEFGFYRAHIDNTNCIECGICSQVCTLSNLKKNKGLQKCFVSWNINYEQHLNSSSGGIASLIAREIIKKGGVAYLCSSIIQDDVIKHIRVDKIHDIDFCVGSKYVQSDLNSCYFDCKNDLDKDVLVLFIGTPCQINGLKNYLSMEYNNLILIDIVCHGVPSIDFLKNHLGSKWRDGLKVSFREFGEYVLSLNDCGNLLYSGSQFLDSYYIGFNSSITINAECKKCKFSTIERVGDITLGDFWGINKKDYSNEQIKNGISLVITNNEKGENLIKSIKNYLYIQERNIQEAISGNYNLTHSSNSKYDDKAFNKEYLINGFDSAIHKTGRIAIFKYKVIYLLSRFWLGKNILKLFD